MKCYFVVPLHDFKTETVKRKILFQNNTRYKKIKTKFEKKLANPFESCIDKTNSSK